MTTTTAADILADVPADLRADPGLWHAYRLGQQFGRSGYGERYAETVYRVPVSRWSAAERDAWRRGRRDAQKEAA